MRYRLSVISDTHTGSTVGLAPPDGIPHPEGFTIESSPVSRWLWGFYQQHLEREAKEANGADKHILIFNGDVMDGGMHHGQHQLYHPAKAVERWISMEVVTEAVRWLDPDHIVVVKGTPSHVGKLGASEESIGSKLCDMYPTQYVRPDEFRYAFDVFRADLDGLLLDVRHHGKMGLLPHTRESYQKRYAVDIFHSSAHYKGHRAPDLALRAHKHKYADSGPVPPHKHGTRLISSPCYQMATEWVQKVAIEDPADIGMVGVEIRDGRVADVFPQVVSPQPAGGKVWTP